MIPQVIADDRVQRTAPCSPQAEALKCRLAQIADGGPAAIEERIRALDGEWSAGRVTKVALAFVVLIGAVLTAALSPWWVILPLTAGLFLLQYLFTRGSWLTTLFQGMGYRTSSAIEHEKFALKTLRGDFRHVPTVHDIDSGEDISRLEGEGGIVVEPDGAKVDPKVAVAEVIEATRH